MCHPHMKTSPAEVETGNDQSSIIAVKIHKNEEIEIMMGIESADSTEMAQDLVDLKTTITQEPDGMRLLVATGVFKIFQNKI